MGRIHRPGQQQSFTKNLKKLLPPGTRIKRKTVRTAGGPGGYGLPHTTTRCFVVPSLKQCRAHFETLFPNIAWDVSARTLARESHGQPEPKVAVCPGAAPLPSTHSRNPTLVDDDFDDFTEPDWASDEPFAMGEA